MVTETTLKKRLPDVEDVMTRETIITNGAEAEGQKQMAGFGSRNIAQSSTEELTIPLHNENPH